MDDFGSFGIFKERILEHWVSSVRTYLCPWGFKTVGEVSKDKWKEEEEVFDFTEG